MFGRVLGVTLTQVLRSVALVLLPTAFISLVGWATAGSATGNTGDPMRAALWIWLGAHQVPFSLALPPSGVAGLLSYLPLGAVVFPILAIRSGINRAIDRLDGDTSLIPRVRALFALMYTIIGTIFALLSSTSAVKPVWYMSIIYILPLSLVCAATVGRRLVFAQAILYSSRIISFLLGISSLIFGVTLFLHISTVKNLTIILEPGILGGLLLLLLNVLYIPNAVVATLGYFSGAGFAIGSASIISPLSFHLHSIPAFPLLGTLPKTAHPTALLGIAVVIFAGALLASWTMTLGTRVLIQSLVASVILIALIAYAGSGALVTDAMSAMGVSPWKFTLSVSVELIIGALLALNIPRIGRR